jgi:hypothetical protein
VEVFEKFMPLIFKFEYGGGTVLAFSSTKTEKPSFSRCEKMVKEEKSFTMFISEESQVYNKKT